jgi:hypothetical protein
MPHQLRSLRESAARLAWGGVIWPLVSPLWDNPSQRTLINFTYDVNLIAADLP